MGAGLTKFFHELGGHVSSVDGQPIEEAVLGDLGQTGIGDVRAFQGRATQVLESGEDFHARVRDVAAVEVHMLETAEGLKLRQGAQAVIAYGRLGEIQSPEFLHLLEMGQALVSDPCSAKVERLHLDQAGQVLKALVGDLGVLDLQPTEPGQLGQVGQAGIGDLRAVEAEQLQLLQAAQVPEPLVGDVNV